MQMKRTLLVYSFVPLMGLGLILGAQAAMAHGFFGGNATPDEIATRQQAMFQSEATILGLSIDEVKAAWADGKTTKQVMEEKGITQEQVQSRMKDMRIQRLKTELKALVDKGVITQAQSDKRFQAMQNQIQNGKGGRIGMMGMGHRSHFGR